MFRFHITSPLRVDPIETNWPICERTLHSAKIHKIGL
jgi:hypothetical protein